jgi:ABC-type phosphate transport system substrate-binding protein
MLSRFWLLVALMLCSIIAAAETAEPGISVIVAPSAAPPKLSRDELALIFKYKKRFWEDGRRIQAVNLAANHPLRRAFSMQVFGHSPEELDDYWRDMYFHGVLPPYVLASDEAVIRFVASTPGAIGYISHCFVDHRVSVVMQLDNGIACPR